MSCRTPLLALLVLAVLAPAAQAGIWTEVPSGTSSTITAIEYQGDDRFWFTTADGAIFKRRADGTFDEVLIPDAIAFNDIEFQPGGNVGLAVGDGGKVYRSANAGDSWTEITGIQVSNEGDGSNNQCTITTPLGDANFVRFASSGIAYIGADVRQLARSEPADPADVGAQATWEDANRKSPPVAADNCYVNEAYPFSDLAPTANPDVFYLFAGASSDFVWFTTNGLTGEAAQKPASSTNGMERLGTAAIDPANPNRLWAVCGGCPYGNSGAQYTEDGYGSADWINLVNGEAPSDGPWDVDFSGGTVLMAGNAGFIVHSVNGRDFFYNVADGALATQDWRAVGLAGASQGAVGGTNGKLVVSAAANQTPDIVAPAVAIAGPDTVPALSPATYTATATDAGGSGVNPNGFAWTATSLAAINGPATATFTFPAPGSYTVSVRASDHAGNLSETASKSVTVGKPVVAFPPTGSSGVSAKRSGRFVKVRVKGKLTVPGGKSCTGKLRVSVKKKKKTLKKKTLRVRSNCRYKRTIKVRRSKVGKAKRLRVVLRFLGNSEIGPSKVSYSTKVR